MFAMLHTSRSWRPLVCLELFTPAPTATLCPFGLKAAPSVQARSARRSLASHQRLGRRLMSQSLIWPLDLLQVTILAWST